jgi:CspA family cold shock protein
MRGKVKWFNEDKGFGFITGEDGKDAFCHISVVDDPAAIVDGAAVEYETETGPKGLRATAVRLVAMILLAACLAFLPMTAGCSQLQARGAAAIQIDAKACEAPEIIAKVDAGAISGDTAVAMLAENAEIVGGWAATATVNWLDYAFGDSEIWCSQDYKDDLAKAAARFHEAKRRAAADGALGPGYLRREAVDFQKFKAARDGTASPPVKSPPPK